MRKPAITEQKPTHEKHLIKREAGLALIKTKPKKTRRENFIKKGAKFALKRIKSAVTDGKQTIKKGADSLSNAATSTATRVKKTTEKGANSLSKAGTSVASGVGGIIIRNYLALQTSLKKHQERKITKKQEIPYSWFLLISLVILSVDRDIFLGEHEGQLTTGWVGFCFGWFTRDKTSSTKIKLLMMSLFGLIAAIKWFFLLL